MKKPRPAYHVDDLLLESSKRVKAIIEREEQELSEDLKLKTRFDKVVLEYTEKFYTIMYWEPIDWDNVYWISGKLGEMCNIENYFVSFNDMRYVVDNNISGDDYRSWYEEGKQSINLENYIRLKKND